jgi:RNA polymerase subunit RPABC4/transcription elongation factor Spt4
MLKKWKQCAVQMNFKKAILIFLAVSLILVLGYSAILYGNFKDRTDAWKSDVKINREYQDRETGDEHDGSNDFIEENYGKEHSGRKVEMDLEQIWKGTCDQCGRVRSGNSKYCDRCGKPFVKECPDCGQTVDLNADYCGNCGKKLNENKEV